MHPALIHVAAVGVCQPHCWASTVAWSEKCSRWDNCRSCTPQCSPPLAPPAPPPRPLPSTPPALTLASLPCQRHCLVMTQSWTGSEGQTGKCQWVQCRGCTACSTPVCGPFCLENSNPWTYKCNWEACSGCAPACTTSPPPPSQPSPPPPPPSPPPPSPSPPPPSPPPPPPLSPSPSASVAVSAGGNTCWRVPRCTAARKPPHD